MFDSYILILIDFIHYHELIIVRIIFKFNLINLDKILFLLRIHTNSNLDKFNINLNHLNYLLIIILFSLILVI